MAGKRGRPLKDGDAATLRRREMTLRRVRRFNERRKALLAQPRPNSPLAHERQSTATVQRVDDAATVLMQLSENSEPAAAQPRHESVGSGLGSYPRKEDQAGHRWSGTHIAEYHRDGSPSNPPTMPSEPWEVVVEARQGSERASTPPSPPPLAIAVAEDVPGEEPYAEQESVNVDTPGVLPTMEDPENASAMEIAWPNTDRLEAAKAAVETVPSEAAGKEKEMVAEPAWGREGYGVCIGCTDMYIVRCDGEESPWAKGSDRPEERDGKFLIECGDCQRQGGTLQAGKRKGGFEGGFGSMYEDQGGDRGRRGLFGQTGLNPKILEGANRAVIADVIRGGAVPFVTVRGGVAFVKTEELLRRLPKGAEVGKVRLDLYEQGQREELIGRGIEGLI